MRKRERERESESGFFPSILTRAIFARCSEEEKQSADDDGGGEKLFYVYLSSFDRSDGDCKVDAGAI